TTVWPWCQKYGPMTYHRLRGKLKYTTTTWHMDENLCSDRRPVGVSVPCGRQPRRHRGLLFVGNTRSWGGQNVSAEGSIESGPSNSTRAVHGRVPDLPRSDSRLASRRALTAEVSTKDQTIRQQSY